MFTEKERKDRIRRNSDMTINKSALVDFWRQSEKFFFLIIWSEALVFQVYIKYHWVNWYCIFLIIRWQRKYLSNLKLFSQYSRSFCLTCLSIERHCEAKTDGVKYATLRDAPQGWLGGATEDCVMQLHSILSSPLLKSRSGNITLWD